MARRKVAYLTPLYFDEASCLGGGERYPLNLARGVVASSRGRYAVDLISFGDAPRQLPLAPGITLRVLPVAHKPANAVDVVSWDLPRALADADLVHIHQAYTRCSEVGLLIAKQQRKPVCITDHGGFSSPLGLEIGSLDLADRIIAYSDFGASLYPKTRTPITVIKGGVDADLFTPPPEPQSRDRVLFVGRLLPHKGIDRLIDALPRDLPLTVCGRPYRDDYFRHLVAISSGKQVEFVT
ncbi:MAG: glycosyltransferase family 4 protein, partial [Isosphaeraceae bacterium]